MMEQDKLNPQQWAAVTHRGSPLLVLAGAGSGKTRVITHRIAHLVKEEGIHPARILALTFTNRAAEEMRSRTQDLLKVAKLSCTVGTFHSFCLSLLRREGKSLGLPPRFSIADDDESISLVRQILQEMGLSIESYPPRRVLSLLSKAKTSRVNGNGSDFFAEEGRMGSALTAIQSSYERKLRESGLLDFDDLLLSGRRLLKEFPDVRSRYRDHFPFVLVDEYQDTNGIQNDLLKELCGSGENLCAVGDEDQSIYRWRGADLEHILRFERDFPGSRVIRLEENYRSTENILGAASGLIAHNRKRLGKTLWTRNGTGEKIIWFQAQDGVKEARWVAATLARLRREGTLSWGDAAILYRTHAQSRLLEEGLRQEGVPYFIVGGTRFYERREVRDLIAYLRVVANPEDSSAFLRILNVPPRGFGKISLQRLQSNAREQGITLWEGTLRLAEQEGLPSPARKSLSRFLEMIPRWQGIAPVAECIEKVAEESGYRDWLQRQSPEEFSQRWENVMELKGSAATFREQSGDETLAGFLDHVSLLTPNDEGREQSAGVSLMTLHNSKGLEFPLVIIVGMEEGIFPHQRSLSSPDEMEEERRLCYVGMTRARKHLYLSSAMGRYWYGAPTSNRPSRFLSEIPEEFLEIQFEDAFNDQRSAISQRGNGEKREAVAPTSGKTDDPFAPGRRVLHPQFGAGVIRQREGSGESLKLTVFFDRAGAKKLLAKFAPLTPA